MGGQKKTHTHTHTHYNTVRRREVCMPCTEGEAKTRRCSSFVAVGRRPKTKQSRRERLVETKRRFRKQHRSTENKSTAVEYGRPVLPREQRKRARETHVLSTRGRIQRRRREGKEHKHERATSQQAAPSRHGSHSTTSSFAGGGGGLPRHKETHEVDHHHASAGFPFRPIHGTGRSLRPRAARQASTAGNTSHLRDCRCR